MTPPTDTQKIEDRMQRRLARLFPASEPPPALAARIAALAARQEATARVTRARQIRWRLAAALTTVLLLVGAFQMVRPQLAAAAMLTRMDDAMRDARSAHSVLRTLTPNGTWVKTDEMWYQNGKWRTEIRYGDGLTTQVFSHGRLWTYLSKDNTLTVEHKSGPFMYPVGFALKNFVGNRSFGPSSAQAQDLGETMVGGRPAHQVAITNAEQERYVLSADPKTNLLFHMDVQRRTAHGEVLEAEADINYNMPLPPSLFIPNFPRTAKVLNLDTGIEVLEQKWAQGITRQHVGERTIVIRDLEVNPEGDVFLLYTAGHYPGDFQDDVDVSVDDDVDIASNAASLAKAEAHLRPGQHTIRIVESIGYVRGAEIGPEGPSGTHFVYNGEKLEGMCYAHNTPLTGPLHLTVTFTCTPVPRHGIITRVPGKVYTTMGRDAVTAVFKFTIRRRIPTDLPAYMPYMSFPVTGDELNDMNHGR